MDHAAPSHPPAGLNRLALSATVHCLTGCAIGEVLGMVIGTALGLSDLATSPSRSRSPLCSATR
jgi:hypothetical protein